MSVSPKVRRTPFSPHSRHRSALHALQCQREGPRLTSKHAWQYHGKRSYHPLFIPSQVSVKTICPPVHTMCFPPQHPSSPTTPRHTGTTDGVGLSVKAAQLFFVVLSGNCMLGSSKHRRSDSQEGACTQGEGNDTYLFCPCPPTLPSYRSHQSSRAWGRHAMPCLG